MAGRAREFSDTSQEDSLQAEMSCGESSRSFRDQSVSVEAEQDGSLTLRQQLQNLARRNADKSKRFLMLYLNKETWLGAAGSKLADQVCLTPARQPNI